MKQTLDRLLNTSPLRQIKYRTWYGMWRADPKKPVYVVEGPLDSLFIPNTIAMVGAVCGQILLVSTHRNDFVLDNEPRNPQIVNYNKKLIDMGHNVCMFHLKQTQRYK